MFDNIYDADVLVNYVKELERNIIVGVENIKDGDLLYISTDGTKTKHDFRIFYKNKLYTHKEMFEKVNNSTNKVNLLYAITNICNSTSPNISVTSGMDDLILKFFKWVFVEEDVNYPYGEGRYYTLRCLNEYCKQ
ncbi:hypothetical protein R4K55_10855 [Brachyspira alvinipulli]|uniref:hypothetical protein n=1 Tax=Brachyspira alvinipulli TaxID=84379 RepID=UPI003005FE8B